MIYTNTFYLLVYYAICIFFCFYIIYDLFSFFMFSIIFLILSSSSMISFLNKFSLFVCTSFSSCILNLSINLLNFKYLNKLYTSGLFHSFNFKSLISSSTGACLLISPNFLDRYANSLLSNIFLLIFPLHLLMLH